MTDETNRRVLIVDDNDAIHEDFTKILGGGSVETSSDARNAFLGDEEETTESIDFELSHERQGEDGVRTAREAYEAGNPYALAFVDVRMPPGIDGVQTIKKLWDVDPDLQVVICTAYADYSLEDIVETLGSTDRLLILKKPFDPVEVCQLAAALTEKWSVTQRERQRFVELEIANRELEKATIRAQEANRTKSDFLANMSHEVRTPMTAILGNVDLLCDPDSSDEERRLHRQAIRSAGEQLLVIINDILDISRIEAGQMALRTRAFAPIDICREVISLLRPRAAEKGLECSLETGTDVPQEVHSDPIRLRQVLVNLVGNAIKFTEAGSVKLVVRGEDGASGPGLVCEVVDTGVGIDPAVLPQLFEPFTQADETSTREAGGTGLGLAISHRLAQLLDGDLTVESAPGKGSTFRVHVPVHPASDAVAEAASEPETPVSEASQPSENEPASAPEDDAASRQDQARAVRVEGRILVVEDGKLNQTLIAAILKKAGAAVELADNGREGCDRFWEAHGEGQPFDLVLMDMQMPVMDGYEATRELRNKAWSGPIVALTAHAMSGDRERCLDAGCTEYATKPVDRLTLLELCRALLAEFGTPAALPTQPIDVPELDG